MKIYPAAAERFKAHRMGKRISLRKFAQGVGISPTYLSHIEQGKMRPSKEVQFKMFDALELGFKERFWLRGAWGWLSLEECYLVHLIDYLPPYNKHQLEEFLLGKGCRR